MLGEVVRVWMKVLLLKVCVGVEGMIGILLCVVVFVVNVLWCRLGWC